MNTNSDSSHIILASGSPRRRDMVETMRLKPEVIVSDIVERQEPGESPREYTRRLALAKAEDVASQIDGDSELPDIVVAADTIVVFEGEVLEKPDDRQEACEMLEAMSGQWHTVTTSFCCLDRITNESAVRTVDTRVRFRELEPELIERYVDTGEPMDKSGSYGIQDLGGVFVRKIEGSQYNVAGLPVCELLEELLRFGKLEDHPFSGINP